jgi:hypothetical protein
MKETDKKPGNQKVPQRPRVKPFRNSFLIANSKKLGVRLLGVLAYGWLTMMLKYQNDLIRSSGIR